MDNQNQEIQKAQSQSLPMLSKRPMLDIMQTGSKTEMNAVLATYKERGVVKYDRVLSVPVSQRIPELVKSIEGRMSVSAALTASIKSAFDNINLRVGLSPEQMVELAEAIIDQSEEDYLSLEDVLLFLQQLVVGKAGKIFDRMDMPTFFELFENYRQARYVELRRLRHEQAVQFKSFGNTGERLSDDMDRVKGEFRGAMGDYLREKYKSDNNAAE